jgi:glycosyltransferase involved in cell wall biosynthesis
MNYRGFVPHDELVDYLKSAHVFAYPCTWPETSCKAMEEAMSAGLVCVHPNFAALPSTSGYLNMMYQWDDDKNIHAQVFYNGMVNAYNFIRNEPNAYDHIKYVKFYADNRYNITRIGAIWTSLLTELLKKYPTIESRKMLSDDLIVIDTNASLGR